MRSIAIGHLSTGMVVGISEHDGKLTVAKITPTSETGFMIFFEELPFPVANFSRFDLVHLYRAPVTAVKTGWKVQANGKLRTVDAVEDHGRSASVYYDGAEFPYKFSTSETVTVF